MTNRIPVLIAPVFLLVSCQQQTAETVDLSAEVDAIEQFTQEWTEAYNRGDMEEVLAGFAADAVMLEDGRPAISGSDAIAAFWDENLAAAEGTTLILEPLRTRVSSDGTFAYSMGNMMVTVSADEGPVTVADMKYIDTLVKEDGEWKWEIGIANSNMPPAETSTE